MISSIGQGGQSINVWQQYAARQAQSTDNSSKTDNVTDTEIANDTENVKGAPPQGPPPSGPPPTKGGSNALSDEEEDLVSLILEEYDEETLTSEDVNAIMLAFKEAGLKAGQDLTDAINENGFDAEKMKELDTSHINYLENSAKMREMSSSYKADSNSANNVNISYVNESIEETTNELNINV
ncbi:hypothetical protein [Clostridium ihumii]|uniref:hypothetical protein n=1 Tax=Clostridium ihumii TaxID=1470356 RepID=UPI00058B4993|nr:hypothetical protein [Clostridium ihumii]